MNRLILRLAINAVALYAAIALLPGLTPENSNWVAYIWMALIFGLINALVRPLLKFLTCPLIILTLGLFTLIINAALFYLTSWIGGQFGYGILFAEPVWLNVFLGALVVTIVSVVLTTFLKDELEGKKRRKKRD
ncbi:MAG: phage holin family protein [Chloroflexi bacterium]|nr:MAG: phage holin family protein [Chloroflexota bacterium]MBL1194417.1 phage holin family protein [Chloroflexota bacterium]NOH11705.1 phage holin family protein [Chloroflexota bacterium]